MYSMPRYITPTIRNSVHMVNASRNVVWMLSERLLKLSVSSADFSLTRVNGLTLRLDSDVVCLALGLLFSFPFMVKHPRWTAQIQRSIVLQGLVVSATAITL